jgi:hypothetical protein
LAIALLEMTDSSWPLSKSLLNIKDFSDTTLKAEPGEKSLHTEYVEQGS